MINGFDRSKIATQIICLYCIHGISNDTSFRCPHNGFELSGRGSHDHYLLYPLTSYNFVMKSRSTLESACQPFPGIFYPSDASKNSWAKSSKPKQSMIQFRRGIYLLVLDADEHDRGHAPFRALAAVFATRRPNAWRRIFVRPAPGSLIIPTASRSQASRQAPRCS